MAYGTEGIFEGYGEFGLLDSDTRTQASPRPWRVNPEWTGSGSIEAPLLDANGKPVLPPCEWSNEKSANVYLIAAAVNGVED